MEFFFVWNSIDEASDMTSIHKIFRHFSLVHHTSYIHVLSRVVLLDISDSNTHPPGTIYQPTGIYKATLDKVPDNPIYVRDRLINIPLCLFRFYSSQFLYLDTTGLTFVVVCISLLAVSTVVIPLTHWGEDASHFPEDIFAFSFWYENCCISIPISLNLSPGI